MRKKVVLAILAIVVVAAVAMPVWKPAAKRLKWFVVATNVYQDLLRRAGIRDDQISQPDFAAIPMSSIPTYIARIETTFAGYQRYGGLDGDRLRGARVLEIGPGETIGVALRFVGAKAAHVTAVDKFVPLQTSDFHRALYPALVSRLEPDAQRSVNDAIDVRGDVRLNGDRISYVYGQSIEEAAAALPASSIDVIVSNDVLEEIYDLDRTLAALDRVLRPGGRQVHVIDLRDYGMFSKHGFHPLEFLTVPDGVYEKMVKASGQPNRWMVGDYRRAMRRLGYESTIYTTWVLGDSQALPEYRTSLRYGTDYGDANVALVRSIRPRLLPRYREMPDEDLLIQGILVTAVKPQDTRLAERP